MLKLKQAVVLTSLIISLVFMLAPNLAPVHADSKSEIQCGVNAAASGNCSTPTNPTDINSVISNVINVLSAVVGVVAVIMIIVGGFRYITAAGNSEKIKSAQNTLMYAVIGLVIVALAQTIASFTLNKATNSASCINHKIDSGPNKGNSC